MLAGTPREAPTDLSCREAAAQTEIVLLSERCPVHVAAQHVQQPLREVCLRPTPAKAVVHPPAIPPYLHQPDRAQSSQVPGDLVLRHAQGIHQLADAEFLPPQ